MVLEGGKSEYITDRNQKLYCISILSVAIWRGN